MFSFVLSLLVLTAMFTLISGAAFLLRKTLLAGREGMMYPFWVIILLIAAFLENFADLPAVIHAFNGVRACVCALILSSLFKLGKSALKNRPAVVIFLLAFVLASVGNFVTLPGGVWGTVLSYLTSPVVLVLLAGVAGLLLYSGKKEGKA